MKAKNPASATPIVSNVVAPGRPMNGADGFTLRHSSRSSPVANAKADRAAETSAQFSEFGGHPPPTSDEDYSGILATMSTACWRNTGGSSGPGRRASARPALAEHSADEQGARPN